MLTHLDNEASLLTESRAGNCNAFSVLLNQYSNRIYRLALQITGNREDAQDVLQEAALKSYTQSSYVSRRLALLHVVGENRD